MNQLQQITFPCDRLPDDPGAAKLLGIYPQRQPGLFMQRIRLPGGAIAAHQLRALAAIATECSPGLPLHLTTRQDIELHGLTKAGIVTARRRLREAGLTGLRAGGNTIRNITLCPGNGFCPGSRDLSQFASKLEAAVSKLSFIFQLPRKFKISLSCCDKACGKPWINDLGLVGGADGCLRACAGGALGARPLLAVPLERPFTPGEAVVLVVAVLRLFNETGDRTNSARARLRHVRERLGDSAFVAKVLSAFEEEKKRNLPDAIPLPIIEKEPSKSFRLHLHPFLGNLAPAEAVAVAEAADRNSVAIRVGLDHDILLYAREEFKCRPELAQLANEPSIVACPGAASCSRGIVDTRAIAEAIRASCGREIGNTRIRISGCRNNCAQSSVAQIGLIGGVSVESGTRQECFDILAGGGEGSSPKLARLACSSVAPKDVPDAVRRLCAESA